MINEAHQQLFFHFDLDGTLFDSMPTHIKCYKNAFKELNILWKQDYEIALENGQNIEKILKLNLELNSTELHQLKEIKNNLFKNSISEIEPNFTLLQFAKVASPNISLVTSAKKITVDQIFEYFKIINPFIIQITYESTSTHKPSPEPYELAILSAGHSEIHIAVEDSEAGKNSAHAANMLVIDSIILTNSLKGYLK
jgi:beta-phosphoglucomutase-like phosphatase (HAD superfamily)